MGGNLRGVREVSEGGRKGGGEKKMSGGVGEDGEWKVAMDRSGRE